MFVEVYAVKRSEYTEATGVSKIAENLRLIELTATARTLLKKLAAPVKQLHQRVTDGRLFAGDTDDKRNFGGFLAEADFGPEVVFAQVKAVITPEHDDGIVGMGACFECIQNSPDHRVGVAGARKVPVQSVLPGPHRNQFVVVLGFSILALLTNLVRQVR